MRPGKVYVGRLPGHKEKVFVRKRPGKPARSSSSVIHCKLVSSKHRHSFKASINMGFLCPSPRDRYVSYSKPKRYVCVPDRDDYYKPSGGDAVTNQRQTCAACGKYRSGKWSAAHLVVNGVAVTPGLCGRCKSKGTSSEEADSRKYNKRRRHRHHLRHHEYSTDDSYHAVRDRSPRRYHRSYRPRSREQSTDRARASSRENINIIIANQPGQRRRDLSSQGSSEGGVRLVRRTSYIELPQRLRSRSRARSSSRTYYVDDEEEEIEHLTRSRHRSRSRSLSRGRRRSRSRSYSRSSSVEERSESPKRRRRRSVSRVHFADEFDEPVLVSKPKRISRRRAVYFDGPGSFQRSEAEAHELTAAESREPPVAESHEPSATESHQPSAPGSYESTVAESREPPAAESHEPPAPGSYEPSPPGSYEPSAPGSYEPSVPGSYEPSVAGSYEPSVAGSYEPSGAHASESEAYGRLRNRSYHPLPRQTARATGSIDEVHHLDSFYAPGSDWSPTPKAKEFRHSSSQTPPLSHHPRISESTDLAESGLLTETFSPKDADPQNSANHDRMHNLRKTSSYDDNLGRDRTHWRNVLSSSLPIRSRLPARTTDSASYTTEPRGNSYLDDWRALRRSNKGKRPPNTRRRRDRDDETDEEYPQEGKVEYRAGEGWFRDV